MKKQVLILGMGLGLSFSGVFGQTYVNEMTKSQIEADCYIEGSVLYNDAGDIYYDNDPSYVQKATADSPTSFAFNMDLVGNKNLTGFRVNMLFRKDDDPKAWAKIEYSKDELNYIEVTDMKVEFSYEETLGNSYWADVYFQGELPSGVKELKVTLLAKPDDANWVPIYRRTEVFYTGGTPYTYMTPPYLMKPEEYVSDFSVDFESDSYIISMSGSENETSSIDVVDNPKKDGTNSSDKVLKIVQAPGEPWGWGNGDWFGTSIAVKNDEGTEQAVKIAEKKYLHFSIYRPNDTKIGIETWNGSADLKSQLDFVTTDGWIDVVVDLTDNVDKTFKSFYYSPNVLFQTNDVQSEEISYLDNIYLSDSSTSSIVPETNDALLVVSGKGLITILNAEGESAEVYDLSGKLVKKITLLSQSEIIPLESGVYIVRTSNGQAKALVF